MLGRQVGTKLDDDLAASGQLEGPFVGGVAATSGGTTMTEAGGVTGWGAGFAAISARPRKGNATKRLIIPGSHFSAAVRLSQSEIRRQFYFNFAATSAATAGVTNLSIAPP